ncbi:MAG: stage 0 sporulation family protein [Limnochordales bacterium]
MEETVRIVGVRFKRAGKIYYFTPGELPVAVGDEVLVETAAGVECGEVVIPPKDVPVSDVVQPVRKVLRHMEDADREQLRANRESELEALAFAAERIAARGLPMKLVNAEYTFDRSRLTFFFVAEERVDFRELVKDLASRFGVRIELRQIGVRDQAKEIGGIGVCGRELCCTTWLGEFAPVSIRMAKEQELSLNPSKLTGQCGRLKCCLKFEADTYRSIRAALPLVGDTVRTPNGTGQVCEVLVARESVVVDLGEGRRTLVSLKQLESGEAVVVATKRAAATVAAAPLPASEEPDPWNGSEGVAVAVEEGEDRLEGGFPGGLEGGSEPEAAGAAEAAGLIELAVTDVPARRTDVDEDLEPAGTVDVDEPAGVAAEAGGPEAGTTDLEADSPGAGAPGQQRPRPRGRRRGRRRRHHRRRPQTGEARG